jgi:hypothetical protein
VLRYGVLSIYDTTKQVSETVILCVHAHAHTSQAYRASPSTHVPMLTLHVDRVCAVRQVRVMYVSCVPSSSHYITHSSPTSIATPCSQKRRRRVMTVRCHAKAFVSVLLTCVHIHHSLTPLTRAHAGELHRLGTTFRVVMPDRVIDLETSTPMECAHWMKALDGMSACAVCAGVMVCHTHTLSVHTESDSDGAAVVAVGDDEHDWRRTMQVRAVCACVITLTLSCVRTHSHTAYRAQ